MLIGHTEIVKDFERLAKKEQLHHGYLFYGPSMVGKRTTALALAKFLEKEEFEILKEHEVLQDAVVVSTTGNSIGIDAVREIRSVLSTKPIASAKRVVIVDNAELLTTEAQNALLKITEEPPASSLIILISSDLESILPTIQSRLQKIFFGAVPEPNVTSWLVKEYEVEVAKAKIYSARAMGKPGLAYRLAFDKAYRVELESAEKFLKASATTRKDLIKKLIEPDEFNLRTFLDAVIITLAWEKPSKAKMAMWHKALALQQNATNFGLNPRLQLESLLM